MITLVYSLLSGLFLGFLTVILLMTVVVGLIALIRTVLGDL